MRKFKIILVKFFGKTWLYRSTNERRFHFSSAKPNIVPNHGIKYWLVNNEESNVSEVINIYLNKTVMKDHSK